jgi:multidrug transporter EmrE-like cation transporter
MFKKRHITVKIVGLLFGVDLLETFTQFCFKKTALSQTNFEIKHFSDILSFVHNIIPSWFFWIGLFAVLLSFVVWSTVLSRIDLSVAVPVCSFTYITIPLIAMFIFHEKISVGRWMGIACILLGVILVSLSSARKKGPL